MVKVDGFVSMEADVKTQTVTVKYDPSKTTPEALAQAITDHSGFEGSVKQASDTEAAAAPASSDAQH